MSNDSTRDAATDRLLKAALRPADAAPGPNCLDAERLAAWAEGEIYGPDGTAIEAHLAGCARCQTMMAAFARTEPEEVVAGAAPVTDEVPVPAVFRPRRTLRWFVPAAATLAAGLLIWLAVPRTPEVAPPATTVARAPASTPAAPVLGAAPERPAAVPLRGTPPATAAADAPAARPATKAAVPPELPPAATAAAQAVSAPPPPPPALPAPVPAGAARAEMAGAQTLSGVVTDKDGGLVPGAAVTLTATATGEKLPTQITNAQGTYSFPGLAAGAYRVTIALQGFKTTQVDLTLGDDAASQLSTLSTKLEVGAVNEVVAVQAGTDLVRADTPVVTQSVSANFLQTLPRADRTALSALVSLPGGGVEFGPPAATPSPRPAGAAAGAGAGGSGRGGAGGRAGGGAGGAQRVAQESATAPLGTIRWRVDAAGQLSKSADGGRSWARIDLGGVTGLVSGAAPSESVCWLVGRSGIVLRSVDGSRFETIAFPEAVDLRSVTAVDALRATVTAASGVSYSTVDGGVTWKRSEVAPVPAGLQGL